MALYAWGEEGAVHAAEAREGASYGCMECRAPVKVRRTRRCTPHFYHVRRSPPCRLYSKSGGHLLLQLQLQRALFPHEVELEHPFPSIGRIADLVWEEKRVVFEIQCSPICLEEAKRRTADYESIGYHAIWLLSDRTFNRRLIRPAERYLRTKGAYYLSRQEEKPFCYDQFEILQEVRRVKRSWPLAVQLSSLHPVPKIEWPEELPVCVEQRLQAPLYAEGDLVARALQPRSSALLSRWSLMEKQWRAKRFSFKSWWMHVFGFPYLRLLQFLLKKV